jgi:hypothetical protein
MAADSPAIPAPTTQTSVRISWSGAWTGLVTAVSFSSVRACGIDAPSSFKGEPRSHSTPPLPFCPGYGRPSFLAQPGE